MEIAILTGGCLLLNESSAESSIMHLSEKPKICTVVYGRLTQV